MRNRSVLEWPTGLTVYKPEKCFPGFTLFHVEGTVYLIDMNGEIVWEYISPYMGSAVLPLVEGGIEDDAQLKSGLSKMPGVDFYFQENCQIKAPAARMPTYNQFIYRCYRIPYEDAPRAVHS